MLNVILHSFRYEYSWLNRKVWLLITIFATFLFHQYSSKGCMYNVRNIFNCTQKCCRKYIIWFLLSKKLLSVMEQKGMTFDHDFCYFILLFSYLLKKEGREKENEVEKFVIKSYTFLFHPIRKFKKKSIFFVRHMSASPILFYMNQWNLSYWSSLVINLLLY